MKKSSFIVESLVLSKDRCAFGSNLFGNLIVLDAFSSLKVGFFLFLHRKIHKLSMILEKFCPAVERYL